MCIRDRTRGWVGAPNERAPFRIHDAVGGFVNRCLPTTRNFAVSVKTLGWVFLRPILAQHLTRNDFFRFVLGCLKLFFVKICAHSERVKKKCCGGSLWNSNIIWQHRVSIGIGPIYYGVYMLTHILSAFQNEPRKDPSLAANSFAEWLNKNYSSAITTCITWRKSSKPVLRATTTMKGGDRVLKRKEGWNNDRK